jgi:hypothetical protein
MLLQVCRLMGNMFVLPIHFSEEHKNMLGYTKPLLEYNGGGIAINPKFNKLIIALRQRWRMAKAA